MVVVVIVAVVTVVRGVVRHRVVAVARRAVVDGRVAATAAAVRRHFRLHDEWPVLFQLSVTREQGRGSRTKVLGRVQ